MMIEELSQRGVSRALPSRLRTPNETRKYDLQRMTLRWSNQIRTGGPILVFIDRGGRFETNIDGIVLVGIGAFADDPPPPHDPRGSISPPSVPH